MRTFSDDIITPDKQAEAIKLAFEAQNAFFIHQIKTHTKPLKIAVGVLIGMNLVTLGSLFYMLNA